MESIDSKILNLPLSAIVLDVVGVLVERCKEDPELLTMLAESIALGRETDYLRVGDEIRGTVRRHQKLQEKLLGFYLKCQHHMSNHPGSPPLPDPEPFAHNRMFDDKEIRTHYRIMTPTEYYKPPVQSQHGPQQHDQPSLLRAPRQLPAPERTHSPAASSARGRRSLSQKRPKPRQEKTTVEVSQWTKRWITMEAVKKERLAVFEQKVRVVHEHRIVLAVFYCQKCQMPYFKSPQHEVKKVPSCEHKEDCTFHWYSTPAGNRSKIGKEFLFLLPPKDPHLSTNQWVSNIEAQTTVERLPKDVRDTTHGWAYDERQLKRIIKRIHEGTKRSPVVIPAEDSPMADTGDPPQLKTPLAQATPPATMSPVTSNLDASSASSPSTLSSSSVWTP